jgi:hypothetical protein
MDSASDEILLKMLQSMIKQMIVAVCTAAVLTGFLPVPATAAETEQVFLGMITGGLKSTAHRIGMDLQDLLKRHHIHLAVFKSSGSVENIFAVYQRPGNHMGLVQSDVLAFVSKMKTNHRLQLIADKVKWVYPLYDQEVQILATSGIKRLGDLQNRRVAIGHQESGAGLTSRLLFEIAGVAPAKMLNLGGARALAALSSGRVDAMVLIDGAPVERLALDVSAEDGLHLIPITQEGIRTFYPAAVIPAGTYAWQTGDVDTVAVRAVLVAYDFRNHHCRTLGTVARVIARNLDWLQFHGHPKWYSVNLDLPVNGWERYTCVEKFAGVPMDAENDPVRAPRPNPVADAIRAVFEP